MKFKSLVFALSSMLASGALLQGADPVTQTPLSRYRAFQLGESLADVTGQTGVASSEARLISSRPERIEELDWRLAQSPAASVPNSVREILFRFYNGALFEMMVTYDRDQTGGLTDADMTEALAALYGPGSAPVAKEIVFNSGYNNRVRAIAQWSDSQNLLSLIGFSYGDGFGVVVSSIGDAARARNALLDSERLARAEAPRKELELRARQTADAQVKDEKLRLLNKPGFRP
jgi:hypothetical protein